MVPSARLLVYYIVTGEQRAELVADAVWINIEEKCGNQLQVRHVYSTVPFSCGWRRQAKAVALDWFCCTQAIFPFLNDLVGPSVSR